MSTSNSDDQSEQSLLEDANEEENEVKLLITKYNLHSIVHSFWSWCLQDEQLLKAALLTLCTLTCKNKLAISLMTQTSLALTNTNSDTCLFNSIVKMVQKSKLNLKLNNRECQRYMFALLTNCAQSSECKNIIWKSNLLTDFTSLELNNLNSVLTQQQCDLRLWLRFLLSLSFSQEGQQFFMKVDSLLMTIIKLDELMLKQRDANNSTKYDLKELQYTCLLILRNLAFNSANKSKLISIRNICFINRKASLSITDSGLNIEFIFKVLPLIKGFFSTIHIRSKKALLASKVF